MFASPRRFRTDPARLLLWLLIAGYIGIFYSLAVDLQYGMRTHKADLGQIDQAVWNSSRGRFLEQTDNGYVATRLTDHVEPILVLISPLFWLWDDVRALLLLQVVAAAIGAWLLYEIVLLQFTRFLTPRERTQIWQVDTLAALSRPLALALAGAYLLAPQLQSAVLTEFHAAPLAVPLVLWVFWAVETRRWAHFVTATLLVAAVKEELALLAAALGIWAVWRSWWAGRATGGVIGRLGRMGDSAMPGDAGRQGVIAGGIVTVLAFTWFVVATFVIVPAHAAEVYGVAESGYFQRYGALGDSPVDIVKSFFTQPVMVWQIATQPARLDYLWNLLAPFGLLALLAPEVLLLALPVLLANLLSAYPAQYYGEFHYSAPLVPYVAVAAALGIGRVWRTIARHTRRSSSNFQQLPAASTGAMTAATLVTNARTSLRPLVTWLLVIWVLAWGTVAYIQHGRGPGAARYDPTPITPHHQQLHAFVGQIPDNAAVTATAAVHPHVSHREFVYQFPMGLEQTNSQLGNATWALLDVTTNTDMAPGDLKARVDAMLAGDWGVVDAGDGFLLLARGAPSKEIPDRFYSFARAGDTTKAPIPDQSRLAGYQLEDWPRWRQTKVVGLWQAGRAAPADGDAPDLMVRTPNGETVTSLNAVTPPALVWYPPARWQPGETVRVTSLPLQLPSTFGIVTDRARVPDGMAAVAGADGTSWLGGVRRLRRDRLANLPPALDQADDFGAALPAVAGATPPPVAAWLETGDATVALRAWLPTVELRAARPFDLWLQWQSDSGWPAGWTAFVHMRRDGDNMAQSDGLPRLFVPLVMSEDEELWANDWRQLTVDGDALVPGEWSIAVGLYNPATGQRADVFGAEGQQASNEVDIGTVRIAAPLVPDQACALLPASCAAQPE